MQTYAGGETDVITGNAEAPNLNWIGIIYAELHPEEDCRSLSEVLWSDQRWTGLQKYLACPPMSESRRHQLI